MQIVPQTLDVGVWPTCPNTNISDGGIHRPARLGRLQREILLALPVGPDGIVGGIFHPPMPTARVYPNGLSRAARESYTRAFRRLRDEGLVWSYAAYSHGGRGVHLKSSLTPQGALLAASLRRIKRLPPTETVMRR